MHVIHRTRRQNRQGALGIRAFACLLWLNLTMLPCSLLAMEGPVCPGCPDQRSVEQVPHDGHAVMDMHDGHQMPEQGHGDCGADNADCCDVDPLRPAERDHKPGDDQHQPVAVAPAYEPVALVQDRASEVHATGPPADQLVGSCRLHAILCVYLD